MARLSLFALLFQTSVRIRAVFEQAFSMMEARPGEVKLRNANVSFPDHSFTSS